jgi:3D (Asp-Asp-Asp) domain-containing protein
MRGSALSKFLLPLLLLVASNLLAQTSDPQLNGRYTATAYSVTGITASGIYTNRHVVAADPSFLPVGTIIKIRHAGKYQGEYVVADTGRKIIGRRLDIYMPSTEACKKFGKKNVRIKVIKLGDGTHEDTKSADHEVKKDVAKDLHNGVVGNAATQVDWVNQKGAAKAAAVQPKSGTQAEDSSANPGSQAPPK